MTDDPTLLDGGDELATNAAALVVTRFDAVREHAVETIRDHVSAAYRSGWTAGYRAGLSDASGEAK